MSEQETYRIDQIVTKTGDKGSTQLGDGTRVSKDDARVDAYGTVDELNSCIGILICHINDDELKEVFTRIQHHCFDLGSELSVPGYSAINESQVQFLEQQIGFYNQQLTPLKEFILPGGSSAAAFAHQARTVCRRAERRLVSLQGQADINAQALIYLNRLSDWLFVAARVCNVHASVMDTYWKNIKRH